jgi:hypothetical protein
MSVIKADAGVRRLVPRVREVPKLTVAQTGGYSCEFMAPGLESLPL